MTEANRHSAPSLLRMQGIEKSFPGVKALQGIELELHSGEVLALLGENGAGKSTLIKILGGAQLPDRGRIEIEGRPARISSPQAASRWGISVIHQEFNLVPELSVRENIFLGRERTRFGFISRREESRRASGILRRLGMPIDPESRCSRLTVAQQQVVEIAKALAQDSRILVMDEPTAALSPREVDGLLRIIGELRTAGMGVVYVSHRLEEIFEVANRVTVLRDGRHVGTAPIAQVTRQRLIEMMVGRTLDQEFPKRPANLGEELLQVTHLTRGRAVRDVSFSIRRGEVLGLTGLVGAGRTELARLIFGADRLESGSMRLGGREFRPRSPREAIAAGVCLLTEDRKAEGLVLGRSVLENFGLPNLRRLAPWGWIDRRRELDSFHRIVDQLRIKTHGPDQRAGTLSGGNQQKLVLAKWLERNADVLIFDEPTRGIDVGARYEIHQLINRLAEQGKAVLMISSELPEVLGMADRILVMHEGRLTGEITDPATTTQQRIMELAVQ